MRKIPGIDALRHKCSFISIIATGQIMLASISGGDR
jgi:hypothetical protein